MKNSYKFYTVLLLGGLLGVQGLNAQTTVENVERTKQILTFGDWNAIGNEFGVDTTNLPTQVKDFYYNNKGNLIQTLEGCVQLGDNPVTLTKVEKLGDLHPLKNTQYHYDENDRLTTVVERQYNTENGWFFNWAANDTLSVLTYNENSLLASKTEKGVRYDYTWEGTQLTIEKKTEQHSGKTLAVRYYSNFVDQTNLAQKIVEVKEETARYIEQEYNAEGLLLKSASYQLVQPQLEADGTIIDGEKGEAVAQTVYTYDKGLCILEVHSEWNAETQQFVETAKTETAYNETDGNSKTVSYVAENGEWKATGAPVVTVKNKYDLTQPVAELSGVVGGLRANSVLVSFKTPKDIDKDINWKVFRNGEYLGYANKFEGTWQYEDKELANGAYDYYVMAEGTTDNAVSNVVSCVLDTTMTAVSNIQVVESGQTKHMDAEGNETVVYACHLSWDAPKTSSTILGYNVYLNPETTGTKPVNSELIQTPYYELQLDNAEQLENNVVVEIVYAVGYVQSAPVSVKIDPSQSVNNDRLYTVSKVVTFGNTMGSVDETTRSKEEIRYYDANHRLMMTVTNGYIVGDDPDTPEEEKAGDYLPTQYHLFDYNAKGQLVSERTREFGVFSGYDRAWNTEIKTEASYKYDEVSGKLIERTEMGSKAYQYEWDGENLVKEFINSVRNGKQSPLGQITYSNFVEGKTNLPQNGLGICTSPYMTSYNRVYEYEYDALGRKIAQRTFKHGDNVEKDENGVIIKADKGTPVDEQFWEYEGDHLKLYVKNTWKSSEKALCPYSKKVYTQTANGVREESYTYTEIGDTKGWTKSSQLTETVNNTYYGETAPGTLTITEIEGKVNSLHLTCDAPAKTYGDQVVFEVYRNGSKVGVATPDEEGKLTFDDLEVPNGVWHYLIHPSSEYQSVNFLSTNVVEKVLDTALPTVNNIQFPVNGKKGNGDYQLVVSWEAPETDLNIVGYNIYTDIKSFTKNPSPVNGVLPLPSTDRSYEFNWASTTRTDKTVCVEVVYNIGKKKSENIPVTLNDTQTGIIANESTAHLAVIGNKICTNGNYQQLDVYAANGTHVAQGNGHSTLDLSALPNGMYIVKLVTPQGTETMKVIKK